MAHALRKKAKETSEQQNANPRKLGVKQTSHQRIVVRDCNERLALTDSQYEWRQKGITAGSLDSVRTACDALDPTEVFKTSDSLHDDVSYLPRARWLHPREPND